MGAFREHVARSFERGAWQGPVARALAAAWEPWAMRAVVRPLVLPAKVKRAVCVGGATLGGSGKTRVAIAIAKFLAERGESVAFVTHGYKAKAKANAKATRVRGDEALEEVGDEAIVAARALSPVPVFLSRTRQEAVNEAARDASTLVIDGPLRITDERCVSVLAVDKHEPWGAGHVPPRGDLKAPRQTLEKLADVIVEVDATPFEIDRDLLRGKRVALFTAIARPSRLVKALERHGIEMTAKVHAEDHGPVDEAIHQQLFSADCRGDVDVWALTEKCAVHLERVNPGLKKPRVVLHGRVEIPPELMRLLDGLIEVK